MERYWLHWAFVDSWGLSLVVVSGSYSSCICVLECTGFSSCSTWVQFSKAKALAPGLLKSFPWPPLMLQTAVMQETAFQSWNFQNPMTLSSWSSQASSWKSEGLTLSPVVPLLQAGRPAGPAWPTSSPASSLGAWAQARRSLPRTARFDRTIYSVLLGTNHPGKEEQP